MQDLFLSEFTKNKGLPIGGGLWVPVMHPELRLSPPYTSWTFPGGITRIPEFAAPALGNKPNIVTVDADVPANASGVIYALGGFSGGLSCYVKDGVLSYEYNLFELVRTHIKAKDKLPEGKVKIGVETTYVEPKPAGPLKVVMKVNGKEVASGRCQSARHYSLPPMTAWTLAWTSARRSASSITTTRRSSSTGR